MEEEKNGYREHLETVYMEIEPSGKSGSDGQVSCCAIPEKSEEINLSLSAGNKLLRDNGCDSLFAEYVPLNAFISGVRVYNWSTFYNYYAAFRNDALKHMNDAAPEISPDYVPFFSYMPQYSQLDRYQFAYYIFLRSEIRRGRYPEADYSYILLLIYEAINLSDIVDAADTLRLLISVWRGYRERYSRLDTQLSDWICDFCLIHNIPFPYRESGLSLSDIISQTSFREFYAGSGISRNELSETLIRFCSGYDYKKSKFCQGADAALYDKVMHGVIEHVFGNVAEGGRGFADIRLTLSTMTRDSFVGALCIPSIKKRLVIEYLSVSHSYELKFLVSDILRYTENRLRAYLKVKSRISSPALPEQVREKVDEYFRESGLLTVSPVKQERPEYDVLYDAPDSVMSVEKAEEIEKNSWMTTDMLVSAFDGGEDKCEISQSVAEVPVTAESIVSDVFDVSDTGCDAFRALFNALDEKEAILITSLAKGDETALKNVLRSDDRPLAVLLRHINDSAAEILGDILIDSTDGTPTVIEDYIDDLLRFLSD